MPYQHPFIRERAERLKKNGGFSPLLSEMVTRVMPVIKAFRTQNTTASAAAVAELAVRGSVCELRWCGVADAGPRPTLVNRSLHHQRTHHHRGAAEMAPVLLGLSCVTLTSRGCLTQVRSLGTFLWTSPTHCGVWLVQAQWYLRGLTRWFSTAPWTCRGLMRAPWS